MPDTLEQLQIDARDTKERGMNCDRLVLRAIGLGYSTRKEIKEVTGFDYGAVEKALERESGAIRSRQVGQIERFYLASENGNGKPKPQAFNPAFSEKKAPTSERAPVVKSDPRRGPTYKQLDLANVEEVMATEETVELGARKLGLTAAQLYTRRNKDKPVDDAVARGRARYYDNLSETNIDDDEPEEVSPVGYIEEEKEPPMHTWERDQSEMPEPIAPVLKISAMKATTGARSMATSETAIAKPETGGTKIRLRYGEVLLECDTPEEAASIINQMRPIMPKTVKRAWSRDFESDNTEDGTVGLTFLYLVSMLHDGMEDGEKEAVWTLIKYLKRMQAQAEQEKELNAKKNR